MISMKFVVHRAPNVDSQFLVPSIAIGRLFRCFGVAIEFEAGQLLAEDPLTWSSYVALMNQLHPAPLALGSPADLFIGVEWRDQGGGATNGMLLTPERSAIGIFTGSDTLRAGSPDVFQQVICHEICHVLNLAHEFGDGSLPTAECPDGLRSQKSVVRAWGLRGITRPQGVSGYPLSWTSERRIASALPTEILPWGDKFQGIGSELMDHSHYGAP